MKPSLTSISIGALIAAHLFSSESAQAESQFAAKFQNPPANYRPITLYWLNGHLDEATLRNQIKMFQEHDGFGGVAPLPLTLMGATEPAYLTDGYFKLYGVILDESRKRGLRVIFYDDCNFPSGSAGGRTDTLGADAKTKILNMTEEVVSGPGDYVKEFPKEGRFMGAVAMNTQTLERVNITDYADSHTLRWNIPKGQWRIMIFNCVPMGNLIDYLSPEAVEKFITLTYDQYEKRFPEHFGSTVSMSFFDDVAMFGARLWTYDYNKKFQKEHPFNPVIYYPALWHDIGPDTEAARVALLGFRAELFAAGYPKVISDWSSEHGVIGSGHPAGAYMVQPVDLGADSMKFYKYMGTPLTDSIHFYGHGRAGFKVPASAAINYDQPLVVCETYGAFDPATFGESVLYRTAMQLFTRGINLLIPHGSWYNAEATAIPPEISWRNPSVASALKPFNDFAARAQFMLQESRQVADIAVLYPIDSMQAYYQFDPCVMFGTYVPSETDYQRLSEILTAQVRHDFIYLHPEILDEKCDVEGANLKLNTKLNPQSFKAIIIPGGKVISWSNLRKIKQFYDKGGMVIATSQLPLKSAEFGHDDDVRHAIKEIFGVEPEVAPLQRIRIEVSGNTIKTVLNDRLIDTTIDSTFSKGRIGFSTGHWDFMIAENIKVIDATGNALFEDDFSGDLSKWESLDNTALRDGLLRSSHNAYLHTAIGDEWTDYVIEANVRSDSQAFGLVFRAVDDKNMYMWRFMGDGRLVPYTQKEGIWKPMKQLELLSESPIVHSSNAKGGQAFFVKNLSAKVLTTVLDQAPHDWDVTFDSGDPLYGQGFEPASDLPINDLSYVPEDSFPERANVILGKLYDELSYIHKVKNGREVFYFANSSGKAIDTTVTLRGALDLESWNPHSGEIKQMQYSHQTKRDQKLTQVRLKLKPERSLFFIGIKGN